jgi:hypothetical protein
MIKKKELPIEIRHLRIDDYLELKQSMIESYPNWEGSVWKESHIASLLEKFPEGQICVLVNGKVIATALSIIVDYKKYGDSHTYGQITGNFSFNTHDPNGDVLYGIEIFVKPGNRDMRLGRRMYDARKDLCEQLNLRAIVAGGRLPGYSEYSEEMTPREYIEKVRHKELYDPILTFQLSNDFHVKKILKGYMPGDKESMAFASLIEWNNVYYQEKSNIFRDIKTVVRIGLVQWQMRNFQKYG